MCLSQLGLPWLSHNQELFEPTDFNDFSNDYHLQQKAVIYLNVVIMPRGTFKTEYRVNAYQSVSH